MTPPEDPYDREIKRFEEAWADGKNWPALFQAVRWCGATGRPLPEWAALAVLNLIHDRFRRPPGHRGDGPSRNMQKYIQDLEHWRRWNTVRMLRLQNVPWSRVYEEAAVFLYKRPDKKGGGPDAIEASYKLVRRAREDRDPTFMFAILDPLDLG